MNKAKKDAPYPSLVFKMGHGGICNVSLYSPSLCLPCFLKNVRIEIPASESQTYFRQSPNICRYSQIAT